MADWREKIAILELQQKNREFLQRQWESSPQYLEEVARTKTHAALQRQTFEDAQTNSYWDRFEKKKAETEKMQLKAKLDAENFETRYTAKDKANISKLRNQQRQAWGMLHNGEITQEDYDKVIRISKNKELGVIPGELPSLSPYPKGKAPGDTGWVGEGDDKMFVRYDEKGIPVPTDYTKTAGYQAKHQELEATKEKAKIDAAERKDKEKYRLELIKTQVPDTDPANKTGTRYYTDKEVQDRYERAYPPPPPDPTEVEHAREYIDLMQSRWGNKPPPEVLNAMKEAGALINSANKRAL